METAQRFHFDVAGERLTAWTWGQGPTVLLIHGWEGRGSQMGAFAQPLVEAGFRVITLDGPGHGLASGRLSSVPQFAEAIAVLVERIGPVHGIVSHSFGSAATGWAARQVPLAKHLVFVAPPGDLDQYVAFFAELLGLSPTVRRRMVSLLERRFNLQWEEVRFATMTPVEGAELLVIQDQDDKESPLSNGVEVTAAWPGSHLYTTSGLGHRRVLRHPEVIGQVVGFLTAAPVEAPFPALLPRSAGLETGPVLPAFPA
jgi:pimeloyl-ACP methyl ester carboxylesterase